MINGQPDQTGVPEQTIKMLKSLHIDPKTIDDHPLEKILIDMIEVLKIEVGIATGNLRRCNETDESVAILNKLISVAEELQDHLEFTLDAIKSESDEHFKQLIDEKHNSIAQTHPTIKCKEDIAQVPAKHALMAFNTKLITEIQTLLRKCFRENGNGSFEFVRTYENISFMTILTSRFETACQHYPETLSLSKDDIFHLPKSSPIWQELHKATDFKTILTEEEADESYAKFQNLSNIGHIIIKNQVENKTLWSFGGVLGLIKDMLYYGTSSERAKTHAQLRLAQAQEESAFDLWNLTEQPFVSYALTYTHSMVGYDEKIYIPRLFPKITLDLIKSEYEDGTFNKLHPMDPSEFEPFDYSHFQGNVIKDLFRECDQKVGVRILAPKHLHIKERGRNMFKRVVHKASKVMKGNFFSKANEMDGAIIIHIHGGGFVSMSSATHRIYLNKWVQNLNLVHFSIDYRLAPFNKYPDALDDVWQAYLWITTYAEKILGIKNQKVILVGDSAGGNLCLALTLRLIRAGLKAPHACLLIYPALYISDKCSSPSLFGSLDDTLLPTSLLKLAIKAYIPEGARNDEDPFISPLVASDELMKQLPPIRVVVGSKDPLYDDSWRLLSKLKKLDKDVKMVVHEHIPHGFLNNDSLKNKDAFIDHLCDVIREIINVKN